MISEILNFFQRRLPILSPTEKIAIEAGDTWWEGELFSGNPDWARLYQFPTPSLSPEEQEFITHKVFPLCESINDWEIFQSKKISESIWTYLKKEKFFGLVIPKIYGGLGFSAYAHSTIVSLLASRSLSVAISMMVPNSLGPAELLLHYGTEEQKNKYLSRLAEGKDIPCFALTSTDAGSDASRMTDKGIICYQEYQGQKTLGIKLTFEKRYITLAPIATLLGLAFKLYDPEHLVSEKDYIGISLCLISLPDNNITIKKHDPLSLAFPNGCLYGEDVFVPMDNLIGGLKAAGHGWKMLMECLSIGRSISLPALSTASSQYCFRVAGAYAAIREQFKQPIGYFEGVEHKLAYIGGLNYIIESARTFTTIPIDNNLRPAIASAIVKYHLTEFSRMIINHAMDIQGGRAIQMGPRNLIAIFHIASPISITVEGANILTRSLMIFGQGVMRAHPFLKKEMDAIEHNDTEAFKGLFFKHIKYSLKNIFRLFYQSRLNRMSAALAVCTDISLLILGGDLKRKENLSARLGDVLSYLYLASSVIKYHADHGKPEDETIYLAWCLDYLIYQIQSSFSEFCHNFPNKVIGNILSFLIFPLGKNYKLPSDQLNHKIAKTLLSPSNLRDKLSSSCYSNTDKDDIIGRFENTLGLKFKNSDDYSAAQKDVLQVDSF